MRWARYLYVSLATLAAILSLHPIAGAQKKEVRRVLILNEVGIQYPSIAWINDAVRESLQGSKYDIEMYGDYMETNSFPDEADQKLFRDFYVRKYQHHRPDLVITVGSSPLRFMKEERHKHFAGIPVVFCEANGLEDDFKHEPGFTGVTMGIEAATTLEAALHLLPGTRHVFVVGGGISAFDRQEILKVQEQLEDYNSRPDITYLTGLAMPVLQKRLNSLPEDSVVLLTSFGRDADGANYSSREAGPLISSAANAPVFSLFDVFIGHGEVGGNLSKIQAQGTIAGSAALKILDGVNPDDVPVAKAPNEFVFDWRALERWGIKEADLPPGSIVLNRQLTVWQAYKAYIIGGIALILLEALLIFALLWQRTGRRHAESQLAITLDRLRMAVEAGRSVGWDWEIKSGRDEWFGDLETMFGIPSDTYSGHIEDFRQKVYPDDRELVRKVAVDARQNREPYAAEFRVVRTDGTVRWISARGKFYYAQNGDAERMLGMAADITERKMTEEALRESEQRLRLAVQAGKMYIYEWTAATDTIVRSAEFGDVLGTDQPRETSRGDLIVQVHPDDRERLAAVFSRLTPESPASQLQYRLLRHDGDLQWVERRARAFFDDKGNLQRIVGVVVDISDRKQAEHKLRESEERFRLVANTAPVMIWMAGPDKLYTYFNQPWLDFTGRSIDAEIGNGWAEMVHPEDFKPCLDIYQGAFDRRETFQMQYRLRRHDGDYRWLLDIGVPRFDSNGSFSGYIGSCIDITDRKLADEALANMGRKLIEAHEEERTWIARELHDDINQRIALLAVELEQWGQNLPRTDGVLRYHMAHLRQRIFDLGKDIQALSHRLHSSKLDYLGIASAANSFCRELSEQQKLEIDFKHAGIPGSLPREISLCLFRVLQESLQNAAKHSGVRHFNVELYGTPKEIQLTVTDLGVGFDPQDAFNGRGLGLISMRERLQLVSGDLSIKSQPGHGTTLLARVPFVAKTDSARAAG